MSQDVHSPERPEIRPEAVTIVTTEHFTLQTARSATVAESTGRATMFLSAVTGGLVALGLVATATHTSTVFYVFGLVLLPTLAFVGTSTFTRVLQSMDEDYTYAVRIAELRAFYFDYAPEVSPYLASVAPEWRLALEGIRVSVWQNLRTVAGMVAVITSVLSGSAAALAGAVASGQSLAIALSAGLVVGGLTLALLLSLQESAKRRTAAIELFDRGAAPPEDAAAERRQTRI